MGTTTGVTMAEAQVENADVLSPSGRARPNVKELLGSASVMDAWDKMHGVEAPAQATVAVDVDGDGRADVLVTGVDRDRGGIPDALQGGQTVLSPRSWDIQNPGVVYPYATQYATQVVQAPMEVTSVRELPVGEVRAEYYVDQPVEVKVKREVYVDEPVEVKVRRDVIVDVPVEKEVHVDVPVEVRVEREGPVDVPVYVEREVVREEIVEVRREIVHEVKVRREVYVDDPVEVKVRREVIVEVPVEKEVHVDVPVEVRVEREVPVDVPVYVEREVHIDQPVEVRREIPVYKYVDAPEIGHQTILSPRSVTQHITAHPETTHVLSPRSISLSPRSYQLAHPGEVRLLSPRGGHTIGATIPGLIQTETTAPSGPLSPRSQDLADTIKELDALD